MSPRHRQERLHSSFVVFYFVFSVVTVLRRESWYRFLYAQHGCSVYKIFSTNSFVIQNYFVILYQMNKI